MAKTGEKLGAIGLEILPALSVILRTAHGVPLTKETEFVFHHEFCVHVSVIYHNLKCVIRRKLI